MSHLNSKQNSKQNSEQYKAFLKIESVRWLIDLMKTKAVDTAQQNKILKAIQIASATVAASRNICADEPGNWLSNANAVVANEVGRNFGDLVNHFALRAVVQINASEAVAIAACGQTLISQAAAAINPDYKLITESLCCESDEHLSVESDEKERGDRVKKAWYFGHVLPISHLDVVKLREAVIPSKKPNKLISLEQKEKNKASENRLIASIVRASAIITRARYESTDTAHICSKIDFEKLNEVTSFDESAELLAAQAELNLKLSGHEEMPAKWAGLSDEKRTILCFALAFADENNVDEFLRLDDAFVLKVIHNLAKLCRNWLEKWRRKNQSACPTLQQALKKAAKEESAAGCDRGVL